MNTATDNINFFIILTFLVIHSIFHSSTIKQQSLCQHFQRIHKQLIINKLNKKGKAYKLLLKAFGNELNNTCNINVLSNDELIDLESILMWFRQKYYVKTELIHIDMDDMYIKFKNIARAKKYFYDYLDEAISLIPQHIIIIERLLNGIVNNKIYTINEIANMFCLSLIEINYIFNRLYLNYIG